MLQCIHRSSKVGRNVCIHARSDDANVKRLPASSTSFLLLSLGDRHHSPLELHTLRWYISEYILSALVKRISYTMWVPSVKHLHCRRPFSIFPRTVALLLHASFSPSFIRIDFTPYSRLTSSAYYLRAPATPRHTHPLPLSPLSNLRGQSLHII